MAVGDGFKIADAYIEIHADPDTARKDVRNIPKAVGPEADRAGRGLGDKVSEGMRLSFVRNSPLIVAAVGAGLAAGAPLAMVGATALFGGIASVAAFQNVQLRESWMALGKEIRDGAVNDAQVVIPHLERAADRVGASFQRLRPQLRDAFSDVGPQIDDVADGIIGLAENAMPGLMRSIERGKPVTEGFQSFLEDTGTGLTGFFDAISSHSPAAGAAMASLGDTMEELLPLLGEVLGNGAELAEIVLPVLADAIGAAGDAAEFLGPLLPPIVLGITGMRIANSVAGGISNLAGRMDDLATRGGRFSGVAGGAASGLSRIASAAPVAGIAIGVLTAGMVRAEEATDSWAQAMLDGGTAADQAFKDNAVESTVAHLTSSFPLLGNAVDLFTTDAEEAKEAAGELWRSMSPLEQANQKVTYWTNELAQRLGDEEASARDVAVAQERLRHWTEQSEQAQQELETAVSNVNVAMVEQSELIMAAADSSLAYRQSTTNMQEAQDRLNEAIKEHGANSLEARQATQQLEGAVLNAATAAQRYATDLSTADTEQGKAADGAAAYLAELYQQRDMMGNQFPAALRTTIGQLEATTDRGRVAAWQFSQLGGAVGGVPGHKYIDVQSPAPWQIEQFRQLGFRIETLPDGSVRLYADTRDAENALNYAARNRSSTVTQTIRQVGNFVTMGGLFNRASGGPVFGPGTGTSDSIPATGPGGSRYNLSNGEHIVTAAEVQAAGGHGAVLRLREMMKSGVFNAASGGGVAMPATVRPALADSGRVGTTVHVASLTLQVAGNLDPTNPTAYRQAIENLRGALRDLERSET